MRMYVALIYIASYRLHAQRSVTIVLLNKCLLVCFYYLYTSLCSLPLFPPSSRPTPLCCGVDQGVENVYTRHKPYLQEVVDNLIKGKLREAQYPYSGDFRLVDRCVCVCVCVYVYAFCFACSLTGTFLTGYQKRAHLA